MIQLEGFEIKNQMSEYTLFELEQISIKLNDDSLDYIEKYLNILEILNVPEVIIDNLDVDSLISIIRQLNVVTNDDLNLTKSIDINGYTYSAYTEDEFKLNVRDLALIEKSVKLNGKFKMTDIIAIIFKRDDLTKKEHYDPTHLKYKAELFRDIKANLVYGYILYIAEKVSKKLKTLNEMDGTNS